MEHAETTGQLPGPVDRSTQRGADVMTGTIKKGDDVHYSMKAIVADKRGRLDESMETLRGEMTLQARTAAKGSEALPILCDLTKVADPGVRARARAQALAELNRINAGLAKGGHPPLTLRFVE